MSPETTTTAATGRISPEYVLPDPEKGNKIVAAARIFLGTKWHHAGRLRGVGVDCAGLIILSLRECGYQIEDVVNYSRQDEFELLMQNIRRYTVDICRCSMSAGDILVFRSKRMYNHCAIYTGNHSMIHAYQDVGCVVEHHMDRFWRMNIHGVYRVF